MGDIPHRRKFDSLQAGRGIAALMVVLCHIGVFVGREPGLWGRTIIFQYLDPGKYGVDFFFILSGVVILLAHWDDVGVPRKIIPFLWKRFRRIYPIYWVVLVPAVIKQFRSPMVNHAFDQRNPFVIVSSFLLIHIRSIGYNLGPSWTLFHEVLFYFFFSVLLLSKKLGVLLLTFWFAASFLFFSPSAVTPEPNGYFEMLFSPLHFLFGFGLFVGWLLHHRRGPSQIWVLLSGIALFAVACLFAAHSPWIRILGGAGLALAILTGAERERISGLPLPRSLVFLGDASYSIYLVHFMVLSSIGRIGFALDQRWHLPLAVWMSLMFVAAVSAGVILHLMVERPLLQWLSKPGQRARPVAVPGSVPGSL